MQHLSTPCFLLLIVMPPMQVQVLYYDAPGSFVETGRRSLSNTSLQEGWASWASADFDNITGVLCFSRRVQSKSMRVGADVWNGASACPAKVVLHGLLLLLRRARCECECLLSNGLAGQT
jgi:hypothetical protein